MPGGARNRSHSLPSTYGIQYGVQGATHSPAGVGAQQSELEDLMLILQRQQQQLDQMTQSIAQLYAAQQPRLPLHDQPLICRRCHRPEHFAHKCDGDRLLLPHLPPPLQSL